MTKTSMTFNRTAIAFSAAATLACSMLAAGLLATPAYALGTGSTFTDGGNTYKVTDYDRDDHEVKLVSYGSSDTTPSIDTVKHSGIKWEVEEIGKGAFDTAAGHKITSVKLGKHVDEIGARAFKGCEKLKVLDFRKAEVIDIEKKKGVYKIDDLDIGKDAFTGACADGVKVRCGKRSDGYQAAYKKALLKRGMRDDVRVVY